MRKLLCILLAFFLLSSMAFADGSRTVRRNLPQFEETAVYRMLSGHSQAIDDFVPSAFYFVLDSGSDISVDTTFGTAIVSREDLSISSIVLYASSVFDSSAFLVNSGPVMTAAISALEYSISDEAMLSLEYSLNLTPIASPASAGSAILDQIISAMNAAYSSACESNVLVYSGNYDYYVSCQASTDGQHTGKFLFGIQAIAR